MQSIRFTTGYFNLFILQLLFILLPYYCIYCAISDIQLTKRFINAYIVLPVFLLKNNVHCEYRANMLLAFFHDHFSIILACQHSMFTPFPFLRLSFDCQLPFYGQRYRPFCFIPIVSNAVFFFSIISFSGTRPRLDFVLIFFPNISQFFLLMTKRVHVVLVLSLRLSMRLFQVSAYPNVMQVEWSIKAVGATDADQLVTQNATTLELGVTTS